MKTELIEQAFGAASRYAKEMVGRGFQARVTEISGVDSSNLNSIIKKDKGASERARREIFSAIREIAEGLRAETYEDFLLLGRWIADGNDPASWHPRISADRSSVASNSPNAVNVTGSQRVAIGHYRRRLADLLHVLQVDTGDPHAPGLLLEVVKQIVDVLFEPPLGGPQFGGGHFSPLPRVAAMYRTKAACCLVGARSPDSIRLMCWA